MNVEERDTTPTPQLCQVEIQVNARTPSSNPVPMATPLRLFTVRPMRKRLLIVDPSPERLSVLQQALRFVADVEGFCEFSAARARFLVQPADFLVANLRLRAYNGLHLVYLAATLASAAGTRSIVYDEQSDLGLLREAQSAGAFVDSAPRLYYALPAYVTSTLPTRDRRDVRFSDRRRNFRGGRRAADVAHTV
jgi:DNA-binding NtrC family response regulator